MRFRLGVAVPVSVRAVPPWPILGFGEGRNRSRFFAMSASLPPPIPPLPIAFPEAAVPNPGLAGVLKRLQFSRFVLELW